MAGNTGRVTEELREIVDFLRNPKKYTSLGARIPKGVLLVGPPGTGKTLLARAVAGEARVPFFSRSGSEFVEMFVGVGAARVRDLFAQAEGRAPCIIFIDELDALGKTRTVSLTGHEEREQTLNQLLAEMDGFDARKGIIVMSATNRPEVLDPALLRAGRFDRRVVVDRPDVRGREAILRLHARAVKLAPDVDLNVVAGRTIGFVGADLANLVNEATLLAARRNRTEVAAVDVEEAIDRVLAGLKRKRVMTVWLGGRAAEDLVFHEISTGAHNDLLHATRVARAMVTEYGMSDVLRPVAIDSRARSPFLHEPGRQNGDEVVAEETAREVDLEVKRLMTEANESAAAILREHRETLDAVVRLLLEHEVVDGDDVRRLLASVRRPTVRIKSA